MVRPMKFRRFGLLVLVALVIGVVGVGVGGYFLLKRFSPAERAFDELYAMPLVGLLLEQAPDARDRLRHAIEEELRAPTPSGPTRPLMVIGELRREYLAPALRGANDDSAVAAMAARAALVAHLQKTDLPACREFSLGGIQRIDKLDPEGQRLFKNVLESIEVAFRSSRAGGGTPLPVPTGAQIGDLLREAGFEKTDFDKLNSFATLSNEVSCEIELKVNEAPPKLPPDKRGPFSRFVIAN